MAIGAGRRHILGVLLRQNAKPTAFGMVAGVILAAVLARFVSSQVVLQHQASLDAVGFAAGLALFLIVAALASLSPAMRALRIDPSSTLREE